MSKRFQVLLTGFIYAAVSMTHIHGVTDRDILSDPVANVYQSNRTSEAISTNLNFEDVPVSHWAKEPITRLGALSVVKGYNEGNELNYRPDANVTKEEALAFLMRLTGQEEAAIQAAEALDANAEDPKTTIWSRGYLQIANTQGLITAAQLGDGLALDQTLLDPEFNWFRTDPVTREQTAMWLVQALNAVTPNTIDPIYEFQQVFNLDDWETIDNEYIPFVEAVIEGNIMVGDGSSFSPKDPLTRAEMAQIMLNLEDLLYSSMGLTQKAGVVGSISNSVDVGLLGDEQLRTYLIRNNEGLVDQVDLVFTEDSQNRRTNKDVPVLTANGVEGLNALQEGDYIEYVVDDATKEIKYISSSGTGTPIQVKGQLLPLTQLADGKISLENSSDITFTYKMIDGLYDSAAQTIEIAGVYYPVSMAPVANTVTLTLQNNLVTGIYYEGSTPMSMEISGIVKEINPAFSFITVEQWNGGEVTKYYRSGEVTVEKENYYDTEDEVGYIDEVYPYYGYDERDSDMSAIEAGDIVHLRLDPANLQYVTDVSAKTNYSIKFGEITEVADYGANGVSLRIVYDDSAIAALDVESSVPVLLNGSNVTVDGLKAGQMVKILINQAVLSPGRTLETVKQIDVDPYGNVAANLYKGEMGIYNKEEKTLGFLNSYTLSPVGWSDYRQMHVMDLAEDGVAVYYDGERITLEYVDRFLNREGMQVYGVTERYFNQEKLTRIILEEGRGDVLASTNVSYSNGYDTIRLLSSADDIAIDSGTIVVKNGHIVSSGSILTPDYAQVVLGDEGNAVVVNVVQEPGSEALTILRGRIDSIDDGQKFNVESNAILKGMEWIYSPVEREFVLSYDTVIVDENGQQPLDEFIDYSDLSKVDEVYTIIADGTKATHLYKNPYATEGVVGTIYDQDDTNIYIRDTYVYNSTTKQWDILSLTNNYAEVAKQTETVIIKNNEVVEADDLVYGDQIRVLVTENLIDELKLNGNRTVNGYIILVE